ncbi:hypothetical protein [Delftia acidovorans]|uniref:hypothetical protein n=1 Tax=Delftia acidovorans TaxID=80866 RepID=UPI00034E023C|nr:hypothetical protein [Delftia acidovorans]EPD35462.1 hypothetical protein HMPREF9702_05951 [Delftia acidovorans CCUG 15835]
MATKPKTTPTAADAPAADQVAGQHAQQQAADDTAQAGETQAPATAGAADGQGAGAGTPQDPAPQDVALVAVRVLAAVTIDGVRFQPDDVIEGMPESVAKAYAGSVDPHPDAVAYARSVGSPVKPFPGQAHAED